MKSFFNNIIKKYCTLLKNIFSMTILRGLEYVVALISMPYLVKTLGPEKFGAILFMQGIIQYLNIFIDYGFNMTAPRDIANSKIKSEIARIFSSIIFIKISIFLFITFLLLLTYYFALNFFNNIDNFDITLFLAVYVGLVGNTIFPIWFFQGIQEMKYIAQCKLFSIIVSVLGIFLCVKEPNDYILAAFLQSLTMFITGILAWIIILKKYRYILKIPKLTDMRLSLLGGWDVFVSTLSVNIYTNSNIVLLRFFTNDKIVGLFGSAVKIIEAIKGLITPIIQAIYPFITKLYANENRKVFKKFVINIFKISSLLGLIVGSILFYFSQEIIMILFGSQYAESVLFIRILSLVPIAVFFSIFGGCVLLATGNQRSYSKILVLASLFDLVLVMMFLPTFGAFGMAFIMCTVEYIVALSMIIVMYLSNLLRWS